eukprot:gene9946-biopygen6236
MWNLHVAKVALVQANDAVAAANDACASAMWHLQLLYLLASATANASEDAFATTTDAFAPANEAFHCNMAFAGCKKWHLHMQMLLLQLMHLHLPCGICNCQRCICTGNMAFAAANDAFAHDGGGGSLAGHR